MPAKPVRVIVSLDRARPATPAIFAGILAVARRRGWRLLDAEAPDAAGRISDVPVVGAVTGRTVTVSADPFSDADVRPDARLIADMAAEHFLARGFGVFAYDGDPDDGIGERFTARCRDDGYGCVFTHAAGGLPRNESPIACLVRRDGDAVRWISDATAIGRRVPADVAVLGVGNDALICERSPVTLSSIDIAPARLGHASAERLHRLLRGRRVPDCELAAPVAVVERESTDVLAVEDADVATAVRFIRDHAAGPLRVGDVLRASGLDRRTLERRFTKHLDRSPADMIRRTRVELAARLLRETSLPMTEIARASGFRLPQHLAAAFKAIVGQTPSDYRASMTGLQD